MTGGAAPPASRAAGLARLAAFAPHAGATYASGRNHDPGPDAAGAVSRLSPYVRYRLVTEPEIVRTVLTHHSLNAAEKYVQEVAWRTYWQGWLAMRPGVWADFLAERDAARADFPNPRAVAAAEAGLTGIDGFDDWARELVATGHLHNHARMWFASIWIFTLRLPWVLGADFFLRHLIDADAASNTLSWRWVAGIQTAGKTYLASADNIARYTHGRFAPKGLARDAAPIAAPPPPAPRPLPLLTAPLADQGALLLVTSADFHPESLDIGAPVAGVVVASAPELLWGDGARAFVAAAAADTAARAARHFGGAAPMLTVLDAASLIAAAEAAGVRQIVTADPPIGPVAGRLTALAAELAAAGIALVRVRRAWDAALWPHATKGFFPFKTQIPAAVDALGLSRQSRLF